GGGARLPRRRAGRDAQRETGSASRRPPLVPRFVRDDPEEPGTKRRSVAEPTEGAVRLDEAVLHRLLGVAAVTRGDERDTKRDPLMHAHELLVGGRIPPLAP